jgi:hypothetical protein
MKYLERIGRWACAVVVMQVLGVSQAGAQSIGLNFVGRSGSNASLDSASVAGVVPQANWQNLPNNEGNGFDGVVSFLEDSAETVTSVSFEWVANDAWNSDIGTAGTPDEQLMEGIQKCNPDDGVFTPHANSRMTFTFRNLLAGSTYNVIVYQSHNGGIARSVTSIGGVFYYAQQETAFDGTFTRGLTTDGTFPSNDVDYVQFDNVSPDANGTITIVAEKFLDDPQLTDGMGVPGVQLVKVTGDWPIVTDPPTITTDPQDFLGVVGLDATFSIVTDGPWTIEWYKNDVLVQTGLSATYTFVGEEADKDAVVYAKAINNIGETTSATAVLTLDDPVPEQLIQGFMRGEHYGNIAGTIVFPDLYNHVPFQQRDYDYEFFTLGGDAQPTNPDIGDFGRVFEGWVVPDTTEDYTFFGNSDDAFELFINPTGGTAEALPEPESSFTRTPDATEISWQNRYVYFEPGAAQTTLPFALTAGQYYAFVMLYKEGGGGDHASVAWRAASDTTPVANLRPIGPENVFCLATPAGKRAELTEQPVPAEVAEGQVASFTVGAATLPRANEFAVQWTRNGVNIPGATGFTLTTDRAALAEDGDVYQAKAYTLVGLLLSDEATLTVIEDTTAPTAVSAGVFAGGSVVGIRFSETMDATSAAAIGNYAVSGTTVTAAELVGPDENVVVLTLSAPPSAGGTVTATGVTDWSGNPAAATPLALDESTLVPQQLVRAAGTDPLAPGLGAYLGDGSYFVRAGGSDIWDNQDAGFQVTTEWTGPLDVRVRVEGLVGPDTWTKGGIMVRESTAGGSRNVNMVATPTAGQNILQWEWRDVADAGSGSIDAADRPGPVNYPNAWLRIVRPDASSNLFQSYHSEDGVNWTFLGDHTIGGTVLPETVVVGIGSTSHNNGAGQVAEGVYHDFSISTPTAVDAPVLDGIALDGVNISIQWSNGGELETAPAVSGPWTPTGDTDGDYSEPLGVEDQKYFRATQ